MSDDRYFHELTVYYLTDYDFHKRLDIQAEEMKKSGIKMLEEMVNLLKAKVPKPNPDKTGKVVKLTK